MSINADLFCNELRKNGIEFVAGVPDSLLLDLCASIATNYQAETHVITANEGSAVAMGIGHYLATGNLALVYMQNSGLGNAINPLISLAAKEVYSIPMLLAIGWRGEIDQQGSQVKDEPQHQLQGAITLEMLELLGIPVFIVSSESGISKILNDAVYQAKKQQQPVALLIRKNSFQPYHKHYRANKATTLTREQGLASVISAIEPSMPLISTTGKLSRELYDLQLEDQESTRREFLTVGGMGHASSIAAGIASAYDGKVVCLDGDGAALMHMGALTNTAKYGNLIHILFNNGAHESVGGQPTIGLTMKLSEIAKKCGYQFIFYAETIEQIQQSLAKAMNAKASVFIEIPCSNISRSNLPRPVESPNHNRSEFMNFLGIKR